MGKIETKDGTEKSKSRTLGDDDGSSLTYFIRWDAAAKYPHVENEENEKTLEMSALGISTNLGIFHKTPAADSGL